MRVLVAAIVSLALGLAGCFALTCAGGEPVTLISVLLLLAAACAALSSDVPTAGAILDRFLHHAVTIPITGRSYRIKDSLPPAAEP